MNSQTKPPKTLLCVTFLILLTLSSIVFYSAKIALPPSIEINTQGQPTIGYAKAKVHLVVFEEPKCTHCREFTEEIYPQIKKEYIDTNKIQYTIIPVSFLPGSMPAAIAALCIYNSNPYYPNDDLFFKFFDYMYLKQPDERTDWATVKNLIQFAQKVSPAINLNHLQNCIEMETYRIKIEQNTAYGKSLMKGTITTPSLYVNGILVKELSYEEIRKLIDQVLKYEGVF